MNNFLKNWYLFVPVVLLFIAVGDLDYGYYEMLRIVITIFAIFFAFKLNSIQQKGWMLSMIAIAVLFNPIFPIYLEKSSWTVFDIISAVIFLVSSSVITGKDKE
jgi:hypothetical protein